MQYGLFETLVSSSRANRYLVATSGNKRKAMLAYRANIRLSQAFLAVLSLFEVYLRNRLDQHYAAHFAAASPGGWLADAIKSGGAFDTLGCKRTRDSIQQAKATLGSRCTHDKIVASMTFGFWKYLFAHHQFMAGGNTLLAAFPHRPARTKQSLIYAKLDHINAIRNRVAHHEPICFGRYGHGISTTYARDHYKEVVELIQWMGIDARHALHGIDRVIQLCDAIDQI